MELDGCFFFLFGLVWILNLTEKTAAGSTQQYFRVAPRNVVAQEGSEVILQCEIENLAGRVQWTKDGFALGFKPAIPGFPRYTMVGDSQNGVYNLRIRNVSLEDDAEFQCQVGPSLVPIAHKPIRASANLTVVSPPFSIDIVGYGQNAKAEVKEGKELTLQCLVTKSKPPAKIIWYRGRSELKLDKREDRITESEENSVSPRGKKYDVSSKIWLKPSSDDDYVNYTCEARHETLPSDMAMNTTVQLSVLYPPGVPYVEGYSPGETLRRGQNVELICRSKGGNPPAQLVWYKNGEQIRAIYRNYGRMSENVYSFTADMSDNNAKYTCEASSTVGPTQMKVDVNLTVYFAPVHVTILGPSEARVGDTVNLNCSAGASNPAAQIRWLIDGRQVHNIPVKTESASEYGLLTSSSINIPVTQNKTSITVICHGVNAQLAENVVATHTVNVLHIPGHPVITGYKKGVYIPSGVVQKVICSSVGGNPLATLTWYKNDKKINSVIRMVDKTSVSAEITILVNATDNDAVYKCEATNPALDIPLFETVRFNVHFPPDNVIVKKEPREFKAGKMGRLVCDSSSSNPEAELSWWREGIPVIEGTNKYSKPGLHGGKVSTIDLVLNITADMDGNVYTCQATNIALGRSVHFDVTLSVLYKPIFAELNETTFTGTENENLVVPLQASGHPSAISYVWIKDNFPLVRTMNHAIEGSVLNITKLSKSDSGNYICEASNSEGSSSVSFSINVHYAAEITEISDVVLAAENENAELYCKVDAVPLSSEHINWMRPGFPMDRRTTSSYNNFTSYLTVRSVTKQDMGLFYCVAYNGIGNETSQTVHLVVKHKPEPDLSPVIRKAASNVGDVGRLICRASGAPKVSFFWSKDGDNIAVNTTQKYYMNYKQLNVIHYESVLSVRNVELSDYGLYRCTAKNSLGTATSTVKLSVPTPPDPPLTMSAVNVTHDSVTLTWQPAFDGGDTPRYRIRYQVTDGGKQSYKYQDAGTDNVCVVSGLQIGTTYVFTVMAYNKIGQSSYYPEAVKVVTSSAPAEALLVNAEYPLLLISCIAATAVLLLFVNICILTAFIYKRKKYAEGANENSGTNKTGAIEMYAPSSYNETVAGETLSSVSEKSETYSDNNPDYGDEKRKTAGNSYIIEQIDYPFQYGNYSPRPKENGSIGQHRNPYSCHNGGSGYHSGESSCYDGVSDPRYVSYPPPVQFAQPPLPPPPCNRGLVPPDVTVMSAPSASPMSTFTYGNLETEGHLV